MADGNGIWIYCQTDKATYCYHSSPTMLYGALVITEKTAVAECMSLKQKFCNVLGAPKPFQVIV